MSGSVFSPARPSDVGDFVCEQILGLMISYGAVAEVSPLPLLATRNIEGDVVEFFGHFGRSNPQIEALRADPKALIVFLGPHAYVSPSWISKPLEHITFRTDRRGARHAALSADRLYPDP